MANPQERAWSEGHKAGKHGQAEGSSPYKKGTLSEAWLQGWRVGQQSRDGKDG